MCLRNKVLMIFFCRDANLDKDHPDPTLDKKLGPDPTVNLNRILEYFFRLNALIFCLSLSVKGLNLHFLWDLDPDPGQNNLDPQL